MIEYIYLSWDKNKLFGYEKIKSFDRIAQYVEYLKKGDEFPAVSVKKIKDNIYSLIWVGENGDGLGGHKRAIAHYIANKSLKCVLVGKGLVVPETDKISIKDITLEI